MDFEKKFRLTLRATIGAIIAVALAATFLMERMSQAIKFILNENVYSIEAAEDMLQLVGMVSIEANPAYKEAFVVALNKAKSNVTLVGENQLIEDIDKLIEPCFSGDLKARRDMIQALAYLADINRQAMIKADENARFLAIAGGWAMAGMAIFGGFFVLRIFAQIQASAILPMTEICRAVEDWDKGNKMRRVQSRLASKDIRKAHQIINGFLDRLSSS